MFKYVEVYRNGQYLRRVYSHNGAWNHYLSLAQGKFSADSAPYWAHCTGFRALGFK